MIPYDISKNIVASDMNTAATLMDSVAAGRKMMQLICSISGMGKTAIAKKRFQHYGILAEKHMIECRAAMRRAVIGGDPFDKPTKLFIEARPKKPISLVRVLYRCAMLKASALLFDDPGKIAGDEESCDILKTAFGIQRSVSFETPEVTRNEQWRISGHGGYDPFVQPPDFPVPEDLRWLWLANTNYTDPAVLAKLGDHFAPLIARGLNPFWIRDDSEHDHHDLFLCVHHLATEENLLRSMGFKYEVSRQAVNFYVTHANRLLDLCPRRLEMIAVAFARNQPPAALEAELHSMAPTDIRPKLRLPSSWVQIPNGVLLWPEKPFAKPKPVGKNDPPRRIRRREREYKNLHPPKPVDPDPDDPDPGSSLPPPPLSVAEEQAEQPVVLPIDPLLEEAQQPPVPEQRLCDHPKPMFGPPESEVPVLQAILHSVRPFSDKAVVIGTADGLTWMSYDKTNRIFLRGDWPAHLAVQRTFVIERMGRDESKAWLAEREEAGIVMPKGYLPMRDRPLSAMEQFKIAPIAYAMRCAPGSPQLELLATELPALKDSRNIFLINDPATGLISVSDRFGQAGGRRLIPFNGDHLRRMMTAPWSLFEFSPRGIIRFVVTSPAGNYDVFLRGDDSDVVNETVRQDSLDRDFWRRTLRDLEWQIDPPEPDNPWLDPEPSPSRELVLYQPPPRTPETPKVEQPEVRPLSFGRMVDEVYSASHDLDHDQFLSCDRVADLIERCDRHDWGEDDYCELAERLQGCAAWRMPEIAPLADEFFLAGSDIKLYASLDEVLVVDLKSGAADCDLDQLHIYSWAWVNHSPEIIEYRQRALAAQHRRTFGEAMRVKLPAKRKLKRMLEQIDYLEVGVGLEMVLDRTEDVARMQQAFALIRSMKGDDPTFAECKTVLDYLRVAATVVKDTDENQEIKQTRPRE